VSRESDKPIAISALEYEAILDRDYSALVEDVAVMLMALEKLHPNYTPRNLAEEFTRNVQHILTVRKSITTH
jgi:hypothetical protein